MRTSDERAVVRSNVTPSEGAHAVRSSTLRFWRPSKHWALRDGGSAGGRGGDGGATGEWLPPPANCSVAALLLPSCASISSWLITYTCQE
eukprot:4415435-Prymnesium_polylepis.2